MDVSFDTPKVRGKHAGHHITLQRGKYSTFSSGERCSSYAAPNPSCNCGWSRWSHSQSPPRGQRTVLAATRCYGGLASPYRTGPRQPARGCASGQCPARLVGTSRELAAVSRREGMSEQKKNDGAE